LLHWPSTALDSQNNLSRCKDNDDATQQQQQQQERQSFSPSKSLTSIKEEEEEEEMNDNNKNNKVHQEQNRKQQPKTKVVAEGILDVSLCRRPRTSSSVTTTSAAAASQKEKAQKEALDVLRLLTLGMGEKGGLNHDDMRNSITSTSSLEEETNQEGKHQAAEEDTEIILCCLTNRGQIHVFSLSTLLQENNKATFSSSFASFVFGSDLHTRINDSMLPLSQPMTTLPLLSPQLVTSSNPDTLQDVINGLIEPCTVQYKTAKNVPTLCCNAFEYVAIGGQGVRWIKNPNKVGFFGKRWKETEGGFVTFVSLQYYSEIRTIYLPFAPTEMYPALWNGMNFLVILGDDDNDDDDDGEDDTIQPATMAVRVDSYLGNLPALALNKTFSSSNSSILPEGGNEQHQYCNVHRFQPFYISQSTVKECKNLNKTRRTSLSESYITSMFSSSPSSSSSVASQDDSYESTTESELGSSATVLEDDLEMPIEKSDATEEVFKADPRDEQLIREEEFNAGHVEIKPSDESREVTSFPAEDTPQLLEIQNEMKELRETLVCKDKELNQSKEVINALISKAEHLKNTNKSLEYELELVNKGETVHVDSGTLLKPSFSDPSPNPNGVQSESRDDISEARRSALASEMESIDTPAQDMQQQLPQDTAPSVYDKTSMDKLVGLTSPNATAPKESRTDTSEIGTDNGTRDASTLEKSEVQTLTANSLHLRERNAQLLNRILLLQGNIQVCCRIRPVTRKEMKKSIDEGKQIKVSVEALSDTEVGCFSSRSKSWKSFAFDKVWRPDQRQEDVFQDVEPMAASVVDGFNACIFAYGQTGSGKTFTMEGTGFGNHNGISPRIIHKIFQLLHLKQQHFESKQQQAHPQYKGKFNFSVKMRMLEIYNEEIVDLLAPPDRSLHRTRSKSTLEIRCDEDGDVTVPNLTEEVISSVDDIASLLQRGNAKRATASTNLNEHSSRSHMVLDVHVSSGTVSQMNDAHLYLVDLAGSERVRKSAVVGKELKEAQHINKSLSALGDVMEALDCKASHVPYRNSKLTHMLKGCFGGNSRTMMVVTVSPGSNSAHETLCALHFATRARRIKLGSAQRNISSKNNEERIKELEKDIKYLEKANKKFDENLRKLRFEHKTVQDQLDLYKQSEAKGNDTYRSNAGLRRSLGEISMTHEKEKALLMSKIIKFKDCQKEVIGIRFVFCIVLII